MSQIWPLIAIAGSWALYGFFASLLISKQVKYIRYTFFSAIIGSAFGGYLANLIGVTIALLIFRIKSNISY